MARTSRTTSLARGIVWGTWWRRLLAYLLFDVLLAGMVVLCFGAWGDGRAGLEDVERGRLVWQDARYPLDRIVYQPSEESHMRPVTLSRYVTELRPLLLLVIVGETASLVTLPFSTRRVRRRLQPLNDLALAAEELGRTAGNDHRKMANLERAIHSASVESPHVSTGDKDLQPIETALNGLLRQMQEARLQQMRFVSDASHELRTPISVIQGYVRMLDRWGKSDEAVLDESIAALKAESAHMQELVEQLLFLARGDSGRNVLQQEQTNLAELVTEAWDESHMIDETHVYTLDIPGSDAHDPSYALVGDAGMIKQVARILIQNAATYASDQTAIALSVRADEGAVSFRVQDEGMGISAKDAEHIFDRFYRADTAREQREGGTGLGLSIAKWIVDAHGGSIEVLSREGVGTRFTVRLPRQAA